MYDESRELRAKYVRHVQQDVEQVASMFLFTGYFASFRKVVTISRPNREFGCRQREIGLELPQVTMYICTLHMHHHTCQKTYESHVHMAEIRLCLTHHMQFQNQIKSNKKINIFSFDLFHSYWELVVAVWLPFFFCWLELLFIAIHSTFYWAKMSTKVFFMFKWSTANVFYRMYFEAQPFEKQRSQYSVAPVFKFWFDLVFHLYILVSVWFLFSHSILNGRMQEKNSPANKLEFELQSRWKIAFDWFAAALPIQMPFNDQLCNHQCKYGVNKSLAQASNEPWKCSIEMQKTHRNYHTIHLFIFIIYTENNWLRTELTHNKKSIRKFAFFFPRTIH